MRRRINIVGDTFTHLSGGNKGYSVHGKVATHIEWVQRGGEATFFIDNYATIGITAPSDVPKYLWLIESKHIKPGLVEDIIQNQAAYEAAYEAIFTHDQRLLKLGSKFKWVPANGTWIQDPQIYPKTKLVSMITSNKDWCEGHRLRLQWVDRLRNHLDLYGRGFNEINLKEQGLCDYMFSVAIENGQYESYFTEKILDCFATGTIPVYLGAPDIGDYFNKDGIIILSEGVELSAEMYYSKMDAIIDNLERVKKMEVLEDFIWENYLQYDFI